MVTIQAKTTTHTDRALQKFKLAMTAINFDRTLIADVQCIAGGAIQIVVNHDWYQQTNTARLKTAQTLQNLWAISYNPKEPAKARIRLINQNGVPLGGSNLDDGSFINLVQASAF